MNNSEIPSDFVVPFPPEITPEEVINRRSLEKLQSRPPNRFFIYRLAYLKELKKLINNKKKLSMTKISPLISKSWCAERIEVKEEYRKLADKVGELLNAARKESFVLITENPAPRISTPSTPPTPPTPQTPPTPSVEPVPLVPTLTEAEINYLFYLHFGYLYYGL